MLVGLIGIEMRNQGDQRHCAVRENQESWIIHSSIIISQWLGGSLDIDNFLRSILFPNYLIV